MSRKLTARTGSYTAKDGQQKGQYTDIGVILTGNNGEYALISPTVDLSGVLQLQNIAAMNEGKQQRDKIMCGIYENQQTNNGQQNNAPQQQQAPQQAQQQNYQQHAPQQAQQFEGDIDSEISF